MKDIASRDFFVDPDIRKAESLPSSTFFDSRFLELELDRIFSRAWLLSPKDAIPPESSASARRDGTAARSPFSLLGKPLFLQRNSKGGLSCFPNVCTHAWHPLVGGSNSSGSLICPQHGRAFDDNGRFVFHKGFENMQNFPRESDHLRKLHLGTMGPLVFACLEKPLAPFDAFTGQMRKSTPGINFQSFKYEQSPSEVRILNGNWKQHAWNYMDNYHIRFVHKGPGGLSDAIDLDTYTTELYEYSALQWVYSRKPEHGFNPDQIASRFRDPKRPERRVFALWWFIFPNLALNFYPWGLSANLYLPVPGKPDKTEFHWYQFSLDPSKFSQRKEIWLSEQVDAEDIEAISLVSKGAQSGFAPRGRFAPREEGGPHWLHRLVYLAMFGSQSHQRALGRTDSRIHAVSRSSESRPC